MQLELNDLRKTYLLPAPLLHRRGQGKPKTKQALAGVSLTLGPGLYGLLGPNGAGKSTLIGIITGGLAADSGEVLWCGRPAHGIAFRRVLGYMPQQQGLYDSYTGRRFLAYMAALKEIPRAAVPGEVARVAAAVNLTDELDKRLAAYSGGMKQRLLLAAALLGDPKLLSLDEPVRFIFSHSALREGWDNPNVFQICTLKTQGESEIRSRQEIGRGLRLCVNQNGERMDESVLGS